MNIEEFLKHDTKVNKVIAMVLLAVEDYIPGSPEKAKLLLATTLFTKFAQIHDELTKANMTGSDLMEEWQRLVKLADKVKL